MALISCPGCGKSVSDQASTCPHCGTVFSAQTVIVCAECGTAIPDGATSCPNCGCPVPQKAKKKVSLPDKNKLAILGGGAVLLIALVILLITIVGKPGRVIKKAQALADSGDYTAALQQLKALKSSEKTAALTEEYYDAMSLEITACLEAGSWEDARALLTRYGELPNADALDLEITLSEADAKMEDGDLLSVLSLLEPIKDNPDAAEKLDALYSQMTDEIFAQMDKADYVSAQKLLDQYAMIPTAEDVQALIQYETLALCCILNLQPNLKNPSSLQIRSIDIYTPTEATNYPFFVINESGQNGFGGYSTSYSTYSMDDLSYTGSCSSLDSGDIDSDDYGELIVCLLITTAAAKCEPIPVSCNINRINQILSAGLVPVLDVERYQIPAKAAA